MSSTSSTAAAASSHRGAVKRAAETGRARKFPRARSLHLDHRWLFVAAGAVFLILLLAPAPRDFEYPGVTGGFREVGATIRGEGVRSDFASDYVGARGLLRHEDAYPVLGPAFRKIGIEWNVTTPSAHPPSALVYVLPFALIRWPLAAALWAVAMLAALAAAFWAVGVRGVVACALAPLALLWPPAAWSMLQLTPLWLLGLALAWRFRSRPVSAGAAIACAALTKFTPTISLVPLLAQRKFKAVAGFAAVWAGAAIVLLLTDVSSVSRYLDVSGDVTHYLASRDYNGAPMIIGHRALGIVGTIAVVALVALVLGQSLARLRGGRDADELSWAAWAWAGVALLPAVWVYSLLPLLPILIWLIRRPQLGPRLLAIVAFAIPLGVAPFSRASAPLYAFAIEACGFALALTFISERARERATTASLAATRVTTLMR